MVVPWFCASPDAKLVRYYGQKTRTVSVRAIEQVYSVDNVSLTLGIMPFGYCNQSNVLFNIMAHQIVSV